MKLKRNCMFFNASVNETGGTPDWEHTLGQAQPLYLLKEDGCSTIINGLAYNIRDTNNFVYGTGGRNYNPEIVSVFEDVKLKVYDAETKNINIIDMVKPLIVVLIKQTDGTHEGRRLLKMSKGFAYGEILNSEFYDEINSHIPNPWFGYQINYDNLRTGELTITIIKAPIEQPLLSEPEIRYSTKNDRKSTWDSLADEFAEIYEESSKSNSSSNMHSGILQKIYYGAPGTGKSHKVNELIEGKEDRTERVTFHPEYDYSSFVGGYKPAMNGDDIKYEFVPQAFINIYVSAWNDLDNDYYLVIEEINRGNCAEIFGDIFQLLDRSNNYKVTPSKELKEYLKTKLSGNENINGSKLLLPPNLNILATMNTSDQSLFPMDSAFKRRWDWEYIPIDYSRNTEENRSAKFIVELTENETFNWLDFIENVNKLIKGNDNLGMDKCLGNYFIKPDNPENIISKESFVNKAIFYLWNDVFKDEVEDESIFKNKTSYEDFFPIESKGVEKVKEILEILNVGLNAS